MEEIDPYDFNPLSHSYGEYSLEKKEYWEKKLFYDEKTDFIIVIFGFSAFVFADYLHGKHCKYDRFYTDGAGNYRARTQLQNGERKFF